MTLRAAPSGTAAAAAPRAPRWGLRLLVALPLIGAATAAALVLGKDAEADRGGDGGAAEMIALPSGQAVAPLELLIEVQGDGSTWARARFLAPGLEAGLGFDAVEGDFVVLCQDWTLPRLAESGTPADQVVVSLSSRAIDFGESDPDTIQFFEAFRVEGALCIWEGF